MPNDARDTYFLDRHEAYRSAQARRPVQLPDGTQGVQICYYNGEPWPEQPDNLVNVPLAEFSQYFQAHSEARIPPVVQCPEGTSSTDRRLVEEQFHDVILDLQRLRNSTQAFMNTPVDSYFLDPQQALATALQRNRVNHEHPSVVTGLQICYYDGPAIPDAPENCISVPAEHLVEFLAQTRLRWPKAIILPTGTPAHEVQQANEIFAQLIQEAKALIDKQNNAILNLSVASRPLFDPSRPLRFWLPANRWTTVMQYATQNLADALRELGHEAHVTLEANDMEELNLVKRVQEYLDSAPHAIITLNSNYAHWHHDDVFHVSWWQDPMPQITSRQPIHWRKRDLIYSVSPAFDDYLRSTGASNIRRQHFCVDTKTFFSDPTCDREQKIVFAGTSYAHRLRNIDAERIALAELTDWLENGETLSTERLQDLAAVHGLSFERVYWDLFHYVVRDITLEWLCTVSPIPVEVYGRGWDSNPIIKPFFRGGLAHGNDIAEVYRRARYAFVTHPFEINTQRLAEVAACGAIPVVFDCRNELNEPHWNNNCVFFRTRDELEHRLKTTTFISPSAIADYHSYTRFAQRIVREIKEILATDTR